MKYIVIIILSMTCAINSVNAQQVIELNMDKVSQFIFPAPIQSIKGGYLPSQILEEISENVLYMQPTGDFSETNLNVITTSGEYFYFTLRYSNAPKEFSHIIKSESAFFRKGEADTVQPAKSLKSQFVAQSSDSESSNTIYEKILSESGFLQSRNSVRYKKMYLTIKGIYVSGDRLYFRIEVENKSNISYDVDLFSFVIKAKTESRNATQESTQQFWTEVHGNDKIIPSNTIQELIFEFDKFTIGKDKILNLELVEKSGERNLVLPIDNDWLIKAREVKL